MNEVLEKIQKIGIVPVVVLDDAKDAAPWLRLSAKADCPVQRLPSVPPPLRSPSASWRRNSQKC